MAILLAGCIPNQSVVFSQYEALTGIGVTPLQCRSITCLCWSICKRRWRCGVSAGSTSCLLSQTSPMNETSLLWWRSNEQYILSLNPLGLQQAPFSYLDGHSDAPHHSRSNHLTINICPVGIVDSFWHHDYTVGQTQTVGKHFTWQQNCCRSIVLN